ncbi:hypothetical protein HWV62_37541 [Athelia sp. TMB]|nr:hypothetical protein HWV62_37541 [Athelia sp. TMB]
MDPEPISPLAVNFILQYILPPSQLSQPLPKHLTSTLLLQRHHFLNISPTDPLEYLCWPSENRTRAFELLEEFSTRKNEGDEAQKCDVEYTSDTEHTYAHVNLAKDLRLVFQWDGEGEDGWKYHDTGLMPFPAGGLASLPEALAQASCNPSASGRTDSSYPESSSLGSAYGVIEEDPADDDDYWNAYGGHDDGEVPVIHEPQPTMEGDGEDAYWAQYSKVQGETYRSSNEVPLSYTFCLGSGDSTVPSPTERRRAGFPSYLHGEPTPSMPDLDDEIPLPIAIRGHDRQSNLVPPSPTSISRRLKTISPRISPASTRPSSRGPTTPIEPSPLSFGESFDESMTDGSATVVISPQSQAAVLEPASQPSHIDMMVDIKGVDDDAALRESIRSVWRLWRMSRRSEGDEDNKETFLRVARQVVEVP